MSWTAYQLVFRLESSLHVGWRKTGNLMQTRAYVPGRIFWGAVTANLTRCLGRNDYDVIGIQVKEHLRFGYFFLAEEPGKPFIPKRQDNEIVYGNGNLPETAFQRKFISSRASTAIAAESFAAREGMLHEVEFITPSLGVGKPVYLVGHLFVKPNGEIKPEENDVTVHRISVFDKVIQNMQIGGERRYGFGRITLCEYKNSKDLFGSSLNLAEDNLQVRVEKDKQLLAHTFIEGVTSDSLNGEVEPLVSREWAQALSLNGKSGPGHKPQLLGICYTPGCLSISVQEFCVDKYGIWKKAR